MKNIENNLNIFFQKIDRKLDSEISIQNFIDSLEQKDYHRLTHENFSIGRLLEGSPMSFSKAAIILSYDIVGNNIIFKENIIAYANGSYKSVMTLNGEEISIKNMIKFLNDNIILFDSKILQMFNDVKRIIHPHINYTLDPIENEYSFELTLEEFNTSMLSVPLIGEQIKIANF